MDGFCSNFNAMPPEARRAKLDQIMMFIRSQNQHDIATLFQDLRNCYPVFPLPKNERLFREYLAWTELCKKSSHPLVNHVFSQG
jgi:hypothetical protein